MSEGIFLNAKLNDMEVTFTIDNGAARTIISERVFRRLPEDKRQELERGIMLLQWRSYRRDRQRQFQTRYRTSHDSYRISQMMDF